MFTPIQVGATTWTIGQYEVSLFPYVLIFLAGFLLFVPFALFRKWYFYRRQLKSSVISIEFEVPAGLTPAEFQYMFGGVEQPRVVAATIVNLVQRGLMHMTKVNGKKRLFAGPKVSKHLKAFEQPILSAADKPGGIDPAELIKEPISNLYSVDISESKNSRVTLSELVHESLKQKKLVDKQGVNQYFLDSVRVALLLLWSLVWWPVLLFRFMDVLESTSSEFAESGQFVWFIAAASVVSFIPFMILGLIIVKYRARIFGRRWMSTKKLERLWPQLIGFRHYVKLSEKNGLKFDTAELKSSSNNDGLAYAIALGFVKNWRDIVS